MQRIIERNPDRYSPFKYQWLIVKNDEIVCEGLAVTYADAEIAANATVIYTLLNHNGVVLYKGTNPVKCAAEKRLYEYHMQTVCTVTREFL